MNITKVCAYCRVSTNSKDQENSFENQKNYFERETSKNKNMELVEIYADKGLTGTSMMKRPRFNDMLYDAGIDIQEHLNNRGKVDKFIYSHNVDREPKFNLILVKNTSRFARNVMITEIIRELKYKKVYVYFLDINKTTENQADELLMQMLFALDENDSRDRSRKVKFGKMEGARNGIINTNSSLYGYKYIKEKNSLEIIPKEAEIIKKIFQLYISGNGIRKIINHLNENKIYTRKNKPFSKSTINRILQNEKYSGDLARNKYDTGIVFTKLSYPHIKPKDEWIIHKDIIPVIINREVFNKAQQIRETNVAVTGQRGIYKGISKYANLLKCDVCGKNYIRNIDRGKVFFNCSNKKQNGVKACNSKNIYLENLEKEIKHQCEKGYSSTMEVTKWLVNNKFEKIKQLLLKKLDVNVEETVKEKNLELEKTNKQYDNLMELYMDSTLTNKDNIKKRIENMDSKIEALKEEIIELQTGNKKIYNDINMTEKLTILVNSIEEKQITEEEFFKEIDHIQINEDGRLAFFYKIQLQVLNLIK